MPWLEILRLAVRLAGSVMGVWYLIIAHGAAFQRSAANRPDLGREGRRRLKRVAIIWCGLACALLLLAIWL